MYVPIPDVMQQLVNHPAIHLHPYDQSIWPIRWEVEDGELVPECGIDLCTDRGWCCGDYGQHGVTIESLDDAECALRDLMPCECSECAYNESDAYSHEEWA